MSQRDQDGAAVRPEARHRVTVTVGGDDLVDVLDALCLIEGCEAGELATRALVERLLRAQADDPEVQELVRARRRRRRRRGLHLVEAGPGLALGADEGGGVPTGHVGGRIRSATVGTRSRPGLESVEEG